MAKRILVLEDDPDFLECVTHILRSEGFAVIPFQQLTVPEDIIAAEPDGVLLDELLPGICGHTICMILKRVEPKGRPIPVMLMSGLENLAERAALCEADDYVQKPFNSNDEFIRKIGQMVH